MTFSIHFLALYWGAIVPNYFDYFPAGLRTKEWDCYSTSFGKVKVLRGASYPPGKHPSARTLDWDNGRTLSEYQILFLQEGRGIFESAFSRSRVITRGTAFLLFPGVWHRYRPDPKVGWTEMWIEMNGGYFERMRRSGLLNPTQCVFPVKESAHEIKQLFAQAEQLARSKPPGFGLQLGFLAAQALAVLHWSTPRRKGTVHRIDSIISEAQILLTQDSSVPCSPEEIAKKLGIGYSHFRKRFKAQTGLSPKQYFLEVRHHRVKNQLRSSDLTIKEIADRFDYSSPFHLSEEFTRRAGISPQNWRQRLRQSGEPRSIEK